MKKIIKYFKIGYAVLMVLMLISWLVRYSMLEGNRISPKIEKAIVGFASFPSSVYDLFHSGLKDERYILDTVTKPGIQRFVDTAQISKGYLLISTFKKDKGLEIRLLDLRKNIFVKRWDINPDTVLHYSPSADLGIDNIRLFHPLLLKDSSLILNTNHCVFKINKLSKIVWADKGSFHHSIEYANDTSFWACGKIIRPKPIYIVTNKDSLIDVAVYLVNSITGKTIFRKSIHEILKQNGYDYLIAIGGFENDAYHLNEVCPAPNVSRFWKKGDLLISLRNKCTVFLYRPSTNKVLWLKTGPWANQHSCTFIDDKRIMILGNDVVRGGDYYKLLHHYNNIYVYDFEAGVIDTSYNKIMGILKPETVNEGRCNILPNGDVLFDESNNGKVYIFDHDKLKLTYCDRTDSQHIKMLNWVRYIPN